MLLDSINMQVDIIQIIVEVLQCRPDLGKCNWYLFIVLFYPQESLYMEVFCAVLDFRQNEFAFVRNVILCQLSCHVQQFWNSFFDFFFESF